MLLLLKTKRTVPTLHIPKRHGHPGLGRKQCPTALIGCPALMPI